MKKTASIVLCSLAIILAAASCNRVKTPSDSEIQRVKDSITAEFDRISSRVIRPAEGFLKFPYLIPAGFYQQMWDWDGYFMGTWFIYKGKPEYMRYWAENFLSIVDERGYTSGCVTTEGPRVKRGTFAMKPFLSQGVQRYCEATGDYEWVRPYYDRLCKVLAFRDSMQLDREKGLYFWEMAFQSGADNNPALNYFLDDTRSFLCCDCSTMQMLEFDSQSKIAEGLGYKEDAELYRAKADAVAEAIRSILWCDADKCFYNVDRETGDFYRRVSYSSFWPLYAGLADDADGKEMIRRYLINSEHMLSPCGLRSLSASDPDYNNRNIIIPFSNWQGPIWIPALVVYADGMLRYGFKEELKPIAVSTARLLLADIEQYDTMHENYDAETGEGLAPAPSYVDSTGRFIGFISWNLCAEMVLDKVLK